MTAKKIRILIEKSEYWLRFMVTEIKNKRMNPLLFTRLLSGRLMRSTSNVILLNDHKTGFNLTNNIVSIIGGNSNVQIQVRTFYLFWNKFKKNKKYIIVVRHPKEIIISGYLYHKKCSEKWAVEKNGYYYDSWQEHHFRTKEILNNKAYIDQAKTFSSPISYQNKLLSLSQNDGIIYEMNSVSKLTIVGMYNLSEYMPSNTLIVKYEDLVFNHNDTISKICDFLRLDHKTSQKIVRQCLEHNLLYQKENDQISKHTTNRTVQKNRYQQYWNETLENEFNRVYSEDVLTKFGYE